LVFVPLSVAPVFAVSTMARRWIASTLPRGLMIVRGRQGGFAS
jgi:hypothetical protein